MRSDGDLDSLLQPTLGDTPARSAGSRPWRLGSQFYVAFFGGGAGVAAIALLNARRLGLGPAQQWALAGIGLAGLAAAVVVAGVIGIDDAGDSGVGLAVRVAAVVAWGGMYLLQRTADRVHAYHARDEDPYDSLWGPGVIAALTGAAVQTLLIYLVHGDIA